MSFLAWVLVAPRLRAQTEEMGSLTIPDFIGVPIPQPAGPSARGGDRPVCELLLHDGRLQGIGNLLEAFLEIPYKTAIVIVFFIVVTYTVIGGFISVVKTDAVQGVIMVIAGTLLFSGTFRAAGGFEAFSVIETAPDTAFLFEWGEGATVPFVLGVLFAGTVKFLVEPRQLSRFYALESPSAARTGVIVSTLAFAVVYAMLTPVGLLARRVLPGGLADTDLVVPGLLTTEGVFGPGAAAFLLVAMVAAAMSSLDSVLLVMASTAERDIIGVARGQAMTEQSVVRATRILVAVFAAITAVIALNPPGGIVSLTALSGAMYGACFGPAILLGLYWKKGSGSAVIGSFVAGLGVLLLWQFTPFADALHQVFPAVALSFLTYVTLALMSPESNEAERGHATFQTGH